MSEASARDTEASERYSSHNLRNHVRKRPDMYLGPITRADHENVRVYDAEKNAMTYETLHYSRALVQTVQELLTNAGDQEHKDNCMRTIRITVPECSESDKQPIVVENDGNGMPVLQKEVADNQPTEILADNSERDSETTIAAPEAKRAKKAVLSAKKKVSEKVWIPTLCFARERAGDNFDDDKIRWTGGRNGLGAKLSNVLSQQFKVEVKDPVRHKKFEQTWEDGMARATKPLVRAYKAKSGMVRVSMLPDYELFGYDDARMDEPTRRLIVTRVFDLAACTGKGVRVLLNGKPVGVKSFEDYGNVVFGANKKDRPRVYLQHAVKYDRKSTQYDDTTGERLEDVVEQAEALRMELLLCSSSAGDESDTNGTTTTSTTATTKQQIGFVNGLPCDNGTHVDYLLNRVVSLVLDHFRKSKSKSKKDAVVIPSAVPNDNNSSSSSSSLTATFNAGRMFCDYAAIKPQMVKQHLTVVAKVLIDNPEFDSQTKETLTRPVSKWGFTPKFDGAKLAADLQKIGVMRLAMEEAMLAQQRSLGRQMTKQSAASGSLSVGNGRGLLARPNVPKYDHANKAGRKNEHNVLILTEGDSAKQLAVAGKRVIGSDNFGIFPLRGKLANVSNMTAQKMMASREIKDIVTILGGFGPSIRSPQQLRYQQIFLFTDADPDGAHIAFLIIAALKNILPTVTTNFPSFIVRFATPIRVAKLKNKRLAQKMKDYDNLFFLTVPEFNQWLSVGRIPVVNQTEDYALEDDKVWNNDSLQAKYDQFESAEKRRDAYSIDYLKGLGSSTATMALRYFRSIRRYIVKVDCTSDESNSMLALLMRKERADDRKRWLAIYDPDAYVDYNRDTVSLTDLAEGEFSHYARAACERALPHAIDGLKQSQSKILFAMLHTNSSAEKKIKLTDAQGIVSTRTGYHHGDQSLTEAIAGMAQNHWGTNNINLLYPSGMFGSRLDKPSVHSAPRYLYTWLEPIARYIFRAEDDPVLLKQFDDGKFIEPEYFVPILPMILINGAAGIGVGFSTFVPSYNPLQVSAKTRSVMRDYCAWVEERLVSFKQASVKIEEVSTSKEENNSSTQELQKFSFGAIPEDQMWDVRRTCVDDRTGALVTCDPPRDESLPREQWQNERAYLEERSAHELGTWLVFQSGLLQQGSFATREEADLFVKEQKSSSKNKAPFFIAQVSDDYPRPATEKERADEMLIDIGGENEKNSTQKDQQKKKWGENLLVPWYDQFQGTIAPIASRNAFYSVSGRCERLRDGEHVRVTELPIGTWKDVWLEEIRTKCQYMPAGTVLQKKRKAASRKTSNADDNSEEKSGQEEQQEEEESSNEPTAGVAKKRKSSTTKKDTSTTLRKATGFYISDEDNSTDVKVDVILKCDRNQLAAMSDADLYKQLHLGTTLSTDNLMLYDRNGRIKRYRTVEDVFYEFVVVRHFYYELRKDYLLTRMLYDGLIVRNQHRFVGLVIQGDLTLVRKSDAQLVNELEALNFDRVSKRFRWTHPLADQNKEILGQDKKEKDTVEDDDEQEESKTSQKLATGKDYDGYGYLLQMPLSSLTQRKWKSLCAQAERLQSEIDALRNTTIEQMWSKDLNDFDTQYPLFQARKSECLAEEDDDTINVRNGNKKTVGSSRRGITKKGTKSKK